MVVIDQVRAPVGIEALKPQRSCRDALSAVCPNPLVLPRLPMPPIPLTEFSSTDVRQSVADGLGAEGLVCPAVAEYILANNLYLDAKV